MGELANARRSAEGPKRSGIDSATSGVALPIFGSPSFLPEDHGVPNWIIIPGHSPGRFDGEDALGWGTHHIGLVDCINIPMCNHFSLKQPQNWATLWDLEATAQEKLAAKFRRQDGHLMLLKRLIVRVRLDPSGIRFIPRPELWNIYVPLDRSQTVVRDGVVGKPVLKSNITEELAKVRDGIMTKFKKKVDRCMQ
jgi:hypothetical protein